MNSSPGSPSSCGAERGQDPGRSQKLRRDVCCRCFQEGLSAAMMALGSFHPGDGASRGTTEAGDAVPGAVLSAGGHTRVPTTGESPPSPCPASPRARLLGVTGGAASQQGLVRVGRATSVSPSEAIRVVPLPSSAPRHSAHPKPHPCPFSGESGSHVPHHPTGCPLPLTPTPLPLGPPGFLPVQPHLARANQPDVPLRGCHCPPATSHLNLMTS